MKGRRRHLVGRALAIACAIALVGARAPGRAALPSRLTDGQFWNLIGDLSEPNGTFRYDNLLSNEGGLQSVLPELADRHPPGGVYVGVGPEQNFTYIAALRPAVAFVVDIRRANLDLHLMYKALFELAEDRAEFVSLLFSRTRPAGLTGASSVADIFAALAAAPASEPLYRENLSRIMERLRTDHEFALGGDDVRDIERIYGAFFHFGPEITYVSTSSGRVGQVEFIPTYAALMQATDANHEPRSFLASEDAFARVKDLEARNLVVPVVGDFAGPSALRALGRWLRLHDATVSVFYLSNVEQYLRQQNTWGAFCRNVASLPVDDRSDFVRPSTSGQAGPSFRVAYDRSGGTQSVVVTFADGRTQTMTPSEWNAYLLQRFQPVSELGRIGEIANKCS